MDNKLNFLITLYYASQNTLLQVALQVEPWEGFDELCLEENRDRLWRRLPPHITSVGPIVKVERLFDVVVVP